MIPAKPTHQSTVGGAMSSAAFGISEADGAHIMGILREGLYSDKILAVLREYGANAWDAHRMVGKETLPIKVTLPTHDNSNLRIRDYGPGLSHDDVFNVYTQYGASTKRGTDVAVGMLGIGSKSGFAYSDSFTIISRHGGTCRLYVASLGDDDTGAISLLAETPCDESDTGVEIIIATEHSDRYEFQEKAVRLFQHFDPRPEINVDLPILDEERTTLPSGVMTPNEGSWVALMGCVPYRVNLDQLDAKAIPEAMRSTSGLLKFGIGEVQVSASREELKYTPATRRSIETKACALVDEFVTDALQQLESGKTDGWQTRLRVRVLGQMDLPLPEEWLALAEGHAKITYTPGDFTITSNGSAVTRLDVDADTRLLIDDTGNALAGYYLTKNDYVVRSPGKTAVEIRAMLDVALVTSGLVGVKIALLSTLHWTAPVVKAKKGHNAKHRARMFRLVTASKTRSNAWSDCWEAVIRTPEVTDIYVVIEAFRPANYDKFFRDYKADKELAEGFGLTMPEVYAYKTTEKKPVDRKILKGQDYETWRMAIGPVLLTPERVSLIARYWRTNQSNNHNIPTTSNLDYLAQNLGANHPIVVLFASLAATDDLDGVPNDSLRLLAERCDLTWETSETHAEIEDMQRRYPLLQRTGFHSLWRVPYSWDKETSDNVREEWQDYVRMCDQKAAGWGPQTPAFIVPDISGFPRMVSISMKAA